MAVHTAICKNCGQEIFKTYLYKSEGTWITVRPVPAGAKVCKPHKPAH